MSNASITQEHVFLADNKMANISPGTEFWMEGGRFGGGLPWENFKTWNAVYATSHYLKVKFMCTKLWDLWKKHQ